MFVAMRLDELYRKYLHDLKQIYSEQEASTITSIVFEKFATQSRSSVIMQPDLILDNTTISRLNAALINLLQHTPVQYITGEEWFCNLKLKVSPAVLIPRPETEELVSSVIENISGRKKVSILDIGTGSGCIAIAIKNKTGEAKVTAIDISKDALSVAKENAIAHNTDITLIQLDFLDEKQWPLLDLYDFIISNPPYIPSDEMDTLDKNVKDHEPHTALFVEVNKRIIFYEKIAAFSKMHLNNGGRIFMETHMDHAVTVSDHFRKNGYETEVKKDMFGKERMVTAWVMDH
jgi:release factor glutamine methyltransferase